MWFMSVPRGFSMQS
uniref:Uncharacterized protein n=1 Tax=Arundo donax TaxID=35708 RepID=A0A0A9G997_ARUDO